MGYDEYRVMRSVSGHAKTGCGVPSAFAFGCPNGRKVLAADGFHRQRCKKMRTLICNVNVWCADHFEYGQVGIDGDKIAFLRQMPEEFVPDSTIDAQGGWLLPGIIDCHAHCTMD